MEVEREMTEYDKKADSITLKKFFLTLEEFCGWSVLFSSLQFLIPLFQEQLHSRKKKKKLKAWKTSIKTETKANKNCHQGALFSTLYLQKRNIFLSRFCVSVVRFYLFNVFIYFFFFGGKSRIKKNVYLKWRGVKNSRGSLCWKAPLTSIK